MTMIALSVIRQHLEQIEPAHSRHLQIGEDEIEAPRLDELHRRLAGAGRCHDISIPREDRLENLALVLFVINDEY